MEAEDGRVGDDTGAVRADEVLEERLDIGEPGELDPVVAFEDRLVGLLDLLPGLAAGEDFVVAVLPVGEGDADLVVVPPGDRAFVNQSAVEVERERVVILRRVVDEAEPVEPLRARLCDVFGPDRWDDLTRVRRTTSSRLLGPRLAGHLRRLQQLRGVGYASVY